MYKFFQNHTKCIILFTIAVAVIITLVLYNTLSHNNDMDDSYLDIPDGFLIGAGSSAFQTEGAWNTSGKGISVLDKMLHSNFSIFPNVIDESSDSYHHYKEDVKALNFIGAKVYRFSMSWPRLLPTGYTKVVNPDGIRFYHALLDELEKNNIQPIVTLYHFDLPYEFLSFGGWSNEKMIEIFAEYARFVFTEFGHRVKTFATMNEPRIVGMLCATNWLRDMGKRINHSAGHLCKHNMLKAHARAYHIYDEEFRPKYNGKIGLVLNCEYGYSKDPNDLESEEIMFQYYCGWLGNPIFSKTGDYPAVVKKRIAENSAFEGLKQSRLPELTDEWLNYVKGSADYFGLNHYHTYRVEPAPKSNTTIWEDDFGIAITYDPESFSNIPQNITVYPRGIRKLLNKIKDKYDNPLVLIMENGLPGFDGLHDYNRIKYIYGFMEQILLAIKNDKCNIKAYIIWSLIDSYEFFADYRYGFGLIHVDFKHPNRTRTPKASAIWLKNVIAKKHLYFDINERFTNMRL